MIFKIKYAVLFAGILLILLLAACSEGHPAKVSNHSGTMGESEKVKRSAVTANDSEQLPRQLQQLSSGWKTNWEKHTVPYHEIMSGGPPRDGIPSIDHPQFISQREAEKWLNTSEPVIALELNGKARAYPLQILIWHEIVNDTMDNVPVMVTFCPLCNSAIVFDRRVNSETFSFGTSGLLRNSDLIMYDRTTESLWQQFTGEAIVGNLIGKKLKLLPSGIVSFGNFRKAYPDGTVLSRNTGFSRNYGSNPYAGYDRIDSSPFLYSGKTDGRLRPMERVVTVSFKNDAAAYPLRILSKLGVIGDHPGGHDIVVFYMPGTNSALDSSDISKGRDVGSTGVFDPSLDGRKLTFYRNKDKIMDHETGSEWNVLGQATGGPLRGKQLTPIVHGDQLWFSWAAFKPDTVVYEK